MGIADSAPLQVLAEGFVTFPGGVGTAPFLVAHGISEIVRGASAQGSFFLVLDRGLIGNAGAVEAVPKLPLLLPPDPNVRTIVTMLGVVPTGVVTTAVSYLVSAVQGVGAPAVGIVMTNLGLVPTDPLNGFGFMVLRGYGGGPVL
jgi:hypothetical protein